MGNTIYLVDGSGYIFRAFHAVAPLSARDGLPTNALFGFTRMLLKLLREAQSEYVAVVFDAGRDTFRTDMYPSYKANRAECPEDLVPQMPFFRRIVAALGLKALELQKFEADDIIATLAHRAKSFGHAVVIVSADKDLMQLVDDTTVMWDTMNERRFGPAQVQEKFGVPPKQVVEVLALMGDASDNVPGVEGIGPKTAADLVQKFGTVDVVLNNTEAIRADSSIRNRNKIAAALECSADTARLSRRLVEVHTSVPSFATLDQEGFLSAVRRSDLHSQELSGLLDRLGFASLLSELQKQGVIAQGSQSRSGISGVSVDSHKTDAYKTVLKHDFTRFVEELKKQPEFSFDLETTSLNVLDAEIVGASFCWSSEEAFYIPIQHEERRDEQVGVEDFLGTLKTVFEHDGHKKIAQNAKYDVSVLARHGVEVRGLSFDTMIAGYLLKPDASSYNLTALVDTYLSPASLPLGRIIEFEELVDKGKTFASVPLEAATQYASQDAHCALLLKQIMAQKIKEVGLETVFYEIEMPLVSILSAMELRGVLLDSTLFSTMSREIGGQIEALEGVIAELAGRQFNLNSPKQLAQILFEELKLPTKGLKKTKTGISTDSGVLEQLAALHELPQKILDYRMLHKLKSTYVDALPAQVSPVTGRLHTRFNQTGTATGRLSSSDPNLQNIPIQTALGRKIRAGFVAPEGTLLLSADYSQIELRLLAHMSADKALQQAFADDVDIHASTARQVLGLPPAVAVTAEQRRVGKTINFGIVYGMGPYRLSQELGIAFDQAQQFIEAYFAHFHGVRDFFERLDRESREKGYVQTLLGRKRILSDIDTSGRDRGFVLRAALNAPIQGSAADVIKCAMVRLESERRTGNYPAYLLLQIHDELVFECRAESIAETGVWVRSCMEHAVELSVPLKVEIGTGRSWEEAHR